MGTIDTAWKRGDVRVDYSADFSLLLWLGVQAGYSQGLPGTITGTVADPSQGIVPGAAVIVNDEATGAIRRTVSNTQGFFSITAIPAGPIPSRSRRLVS